MYLELLLPCLTFIPVILMCCLLYIGGEEDFCIKEKDKK